MAENPSWDSPLDESVRVEFHNWQASIPLLTQYKIPRWWNTDDTEDVASEQAHFFSDASTSGYAAVGYRRVTGASGAVHVTIITARSHVVPLNPAKASHHNRRRQVGGDSPIYRVSFEKTNADVYVD